MPSHKDALPVEAILVIMALTLFAFSFGLPRFVWKHGFRSSGWKLPRLRLEAHVIYWISVELQLPRRIQILPEGKLELPVFGLTISQSCSRVHCHLADCQVLRGCIAEHKLATQANGHKSPKVESGGRLRHPAWLSSRESLSEVGVELLGGSILAVDKRSRWFERWKIDFRWFSSLKDNMG